MKFYRLEPEVAGGLGPHTELDRSVHPPLVMTLHYVFDGWSGDDIVTTFPCFIGTRQFVDAITPLQPTGVEFDKVEISKSGEFEDLYPDRELPEFVWLKINGRPGKDDFGLPNGYGLVVSERILGVLQTRNLRNAKIEEYKSLE